MIQNIVPASIGALVVAAVALFLGIFQVVLTWNLKKEPWNKWGAVISFSVALHAVSVVIQYNTGESIANRLCEHAQFTAFIFLIYAGYKFTIEYLSIRENFLFKKGVLWLQPILLIITWWPDLAVKDEFIYHDFIGRSTYYIEPAKGLFGHVIFLYALVFGFYFICLWVKKRHDAIIESRFFIGGFSFWFLMGVHDFLSSIGISPFQYLLVYGFLGYAPAIVAITIIKHLQMHRTIEKSVFELQKAKDELELRVSERTLDLSSRNEELNTALTALKESEKKISFLSNQTEHLSLAAASMIFIKDEREFFQKISRAIVEHSDYKRVLISLFKETSPYREIIGYGGLDESVVRKLEKVEIPAKQYDGVFAQGFKIGQLSYYIPHTMKHILQQDATVYGEGPQSDNDNSWHPEDNLFVKMNNDKCEFIGVISVDDSKSGLKPSDETVRPLEIFSSLISQLILYKREQKRIIKLEEQLLQARKMESIGTLAGGIAHDFNNILNIIVGNIELVLEKIPASSELMRNLQPIKHASLKGADIVNQLLSFSKNAEQTFKPVKIEALLQDLLRLIKSSIPSTIDIIPDIRVERAVVMGDPVQINQVFLNLCINASQSMEETGGVIEIAAEEARVDATMRSQFPGLEQGEYVKITISDNGRGIPEDLIDRIFDPYFTTKDVGKGSGIGLAVVHGIVESHNGCITVESKQGKGSSFVVYLPLIDEEPEKDTPLKVELQTGTEKLLLVDDEKFILDMTEDILVRLGYTVSKFQQPIEALSVFREDPEAFDIVISDMTMPKMTGKTLAKELITLSCDIPIIICTGYSELIDGKSAKELNISAVIMKPIRVAELARIVRDVLDGQ